MIIRITDAEMRTTLICFTTVLFGTGVIKCTSIHPAIHHLRPFMLFKVTGPGLSWAGGGEHCGQTISLSHCHYYPELIRIQSAVSYISNIEQDLIDSQTNKVPAVSYLVTICYLVTSSWSCHKLSKEGEVRIFNLVTLPSKALTFRPL